MQKYIKKIGSGTTTLIISNDEMDNILKIVKSLDDSSLLLKGVSETIQNEVKEQKRGFLSMLLGTLGASLVGNLSASEEINRNEDGTIATRQGREIIKPGFRRSVNKKFLILKYKNIIRINLGLMDFILDLIYLLK